MKYVQKSQIVSAYDKEYVISLVPKNSGKNKGFGIVEGLFYLAVFFPFVSFGINFGTDTQPLALFMAILIIFVFAKSHIPYEILGFAVAVMLVSTTVCLLSLFNAVSLFEAIRSMANYCSIALIPLATYLVLQKNGGLNERLLKTIIIIWFLVALVQFAFNREFGSFLLANFRTTDGRGVNSLTNEPSFYGYMCVFALILVQTFKKGRKVFSVLLLVQIIFFAASAVSLVYLVIAALLYLMYSFFHVSLKSFLQICGLVAAGLLTLWFLIDYLPHMRITQLLERFLNNPLSLLNDESFAIRYSEIVDSFGLFVGNAFLPSLFQGRRIISGYGSLLVELGFFGLIFIVGLSIIVLKSNSGSSCYRFVVAILLMAMMFSGIQLANPAFSFLLGFFAYGSKLLEVNRCDKHTIPA